MRSPIRVLLLVPLAIAAVGCGKSVRYEGTIVLDEIEAPDPALLYVGISTETGEKAAEPTTEDPDARLWKKTANGDAIDFVLEFEGSEIQLNARFWYDTDGDGVQGPGDRIGRLARTTTGRDNGLVVGNITTIEPLHLTKEPPSAVAPAKPSRPADTAKPRKPAAPDKSMKTAEPSKTAKPSETAKPSKTAKPVKPAKKE